jgi:hypothetical protein
MSLLCWGAWPLLAPLVPPLVTCPASVHNVQTNESDGKYMERANEKKGKNVSWGAKYTEEYYKRENIHVMSCKLRVQRFETYFYEVNVWSPKTANRDNWSLKYAIFSHFGSWTWSSCFFYGKIKLLFRVFFYPRKLLFSWVHTINVCFFALLHCT